MDSNGNRALDRRAAPRTSVSGDYTAAEPNPPLSPKQAPRRPPGWRTLRVFRDGEELGAIIDWGRPGAFEAIDPRGRSRGRSFDSASTAALALDRCARRKAGGAA